MGDAGARTTLMNIPTRKTLFLLGFVVAIVVSGFGHHVFAEPDDGTQFFNLSLPDFKLYTAEQVTGFSCLVRGGGIAQVSVPFQWDVNVDGSLGGRTQLTASAVVGNSAFYQPDLAPFHDGFLTIAKDRPALKEMNLDVTVVLTITNNETDKERKLTFTTKQLILTRTDERSPWW
jgi:hypothetical protein